MQTYHQRRHTPLSKANVATTPTITTITRLEQKLGQGIAGHLDQQPSGETNTSGDGHASHLGCGSLAGGASSSRGRSRGSRGRSRGGTAGGRGGGATGGASGGLEGRGERRGNGRKSGAESRCSRRSLRGDRRADAGSSRRSTAGGASADGAVDGGEASGGGLDAAVRVGGGSDKSLGGDGGALGSRSGSNAGGSTEGIGQDGKSGRDGVGAGGGNAAAETSSVRDSLSRLRGAASLASAVTDTVGPVALGAEAANVTGSAAELRVGDEVHVVDTHLSARGEAVLGHGDASSNSEDGEGLHCELDEGILRNEVLELRIWVA